MGPQVPGEQLSIGASCDPDTKGVPEKQPALPHGEPQRLTNSELPVALGPVLGISPSWFPQAELLASIIHSPNC